MIEEDSRSGTASLQLLYEAPEKTAADGEFLEVITDHGAEFLVNRRDADGNADHSCENYLAKNAIQQTLSAVGRPQSTGKIERFFQTYDSTAGVSIPSRNLSIIPTTADRINSFDTTT